jgi:hypothetical protein
MSLEQGAHGSIAAERVVVERALREATATLRKRRAALRRAGEQMKLRPGECDVVHLADAATAYQSALDRMRFVQNQLRRLHARGRSHTRLEAFCGDDHETLHGRLAPLEV